MKVKIEFVKDHVIHYEVVEIDADFVEHISVDGEAWKSVWDF